MTNKALDLLTTWLSFREFSLQQVLQQFPIAQDQIGHDANYMQLDGLTELYDPDTYPGHFFFRQGKLVLFYAEDISEQIETLKPNFLAQHLGQPDAVLRSRAGKTHNHYVYADKGIAYSANSNQVSYLEIFQPCSLDTYKSQMYFEPSPFIR